ncbi:MAG: hypothetical protein KDH96_04055 [Candidatus Riesia sp.]|nr:hypothetical protein [Candidatus Riesia sp.]
MNTLGMGTFDLTNNNAGDAGSLVATSFDAFGRQRVSSPSTTLDLKLNNDFNTDVTWSTSTSGGGAIAHTQATASVALTVGATASDRAVIQSRSKGIYYPGKSLQIMMTFVLGSNSSGVTKRCGYFDDLNGLFIQQGEDGVISFVIRNQSVDTVVPQSSWNGDTMDGNGMSGITLNPEAAQILFIDVEWLGVGSVRFGFVVDGKFILCHSQHHANSVTGVYMGNPNLPIRYEISTTGGDPSSLKAICSTVIAEGGPDSVGRTIAPSRGITEKAVAGNSWGELLSVRIRDAYKNSANLVPFNISVLNSSTTDYYWELVLNDPDMSSGTYVSTGTLTEFSINRTGTPTGSGFILASGYGASVVGSPSQIYFDFKSVLKVACGISGVADILSLRVRNMTIGSDDFYGAVTLQEEI